MATDPHQVVAERLQALREKLEAVEPFPWDNVDAWISGAAPFLKRAFGDCYEEFGRITRAPDFRSWARFNALQRGDSPDECDRAVAREAQKHREEAQTAKKKILAFLDGLVGLPDVPTPPMHGSPMTVGGDLILGDKTDTSFINSPVGAAATAPGAVASGGLTVEQVREDVGRAQTALIQDQATLDDIHHLLFEGLFQLLRSVRKIEIAATAPETFHAQVREEAVKVWTDKGLERVRLSQGLEVVKSLLSSPVLAELAKFLMSGPLS